MNDLRCLPKTPGIYCFENKINGHKYIGKSVNIYKRVWDHINSLRIGKDKCSYLQKAWNKYGEESFEIFILEKCVKEDLDYYEKYFIKYYNTKSPDGYNLTDGGDGTFGYKWDDEKRNSVKGNKNPFYGKQHSEETKQHWSENRKGDKNYNFGRVFSQETRQKMKDNHADFSGENAPHFGKHLSEETKKKISESLGDMNGQNNPRFGKVMKNKSSKYRGVFYNKANRVYVAQITLNSKKIYIGSSKDEIVAAKLYDEYIIENNLPNKLNFEK